MEAMLFISNSCTFILEQLFSNARLIISKMIPVNRIIEVAIKFWDQNKIVDSALAAICGMTD